MANLTREQIKEINEALNTMDLYMYEMEWIGIPLESDSDEDIKEYMDRWNVLRACYNEIKEVFNNVLR